MLSMMRTGLLIGFGVAMIGTQLAAQTQRVDFNRDIRPILANKCFACHGPDSAVREADLRLDVADGLQKKRDGQAVIDLKQPDQSLLLKKVQATGEQRMPPVEAGAALTSAEIGLLRRWIAQGATYARHWSYEPPRRPAVPAVKTKNWVRNPIDAFVLSRMEQARFAPRPEATRSTLIRRLSLDLTGLPPSLDEVNAFVNDKQDGAYERLVNRLLDDEAYGERWAAMWLDLARYADSAGYADDPPRTIWLYRDWVIDAYNANMPFDQFTIQQLAGDMLPNPTTSQLQATAFHRNTLTNSEGGTNDEEFRNVAIVDRVNTTMQVWMGTTIRCAQCHNHKYDPITQEEYFRFFAIFNQSADADRRDEQPLLSVLSDSQKKQQQTWETEIAELERKALPTADQQRAWERDLLRKRDWQVLRPRSLKSTAGTTFRVLEDGVIVAEGPAAESETYTLNFETDLSGLTGFRLEALPHDDLPRKGPGRSDNGQFVLTEFGLAQGAVGSDTINGRYVRIDLAGKGKMVHLAEVQVFAGGTNVARQGTARQSSTDFDGPAQRAIDGNTDGIYANKSVTHTAISTDPWWEVDLKQPQDIQRILVWNRTDSKLQSRLNGFKLSVLDKDRQTVWSQTFAQAPQRELTADTSGLSTVEFQQVSATSERDAAGKNPFGGWKIAASVDRDAQGAQWGWSSDVGRAASAVFQTKTDVGTDAGTQLQVTLTQAAGGRQLLGRFRLLATQSPRPVVTAADPITRIAAIDDAQRTTAQRKAVADAFRAVHQAPKPLTDQIAQLRKKIKELKPATVPIMRELPADKQRITKIQIRGNFLVTGKQVSQGVPQVFHPFPEQESLNRLGLARWLVHKDNPLTARVLVNRYWEQLFGAGLVRTSEEFGIQGELPSHPLLLDWLATELVAQQWDIKQLLRLVVTSATYRQSSQVTPDLLERDFANRLITRGPRVRLSAEMIRDQALAVSGLLSQKLGGPSVQPPRPKLGLKAAFGGSTDWNTSPGEDRYRRGLYTSWRRSLPYPSMATFDAPSRNVCMIRRIPTNTPLQALVTLNDPVYIEAAQALARRIVASGPKSLAGRVDFGFQTVLARRPHAGERQRLQQLYKQTYARYQGDPQQARMLATVPLGPAAADADHAELAAWTVVANVLLNLDETLAKR